MTKDLSRQLCELAGIEALVVERYKIGNDDAYHYFGSKEEHKKFKEDLLSRSPINGSVVDFEGYIDSVYPNFETPENFVKLLECLWEVSYWVRFKNDDVFDGCATIGNQSTNDDLFKNAIIKSLIKNLEDKKFEHSKLKQALQATEWTY